MGNDDHDDPVAFYMREVASMKIVAKDEEMQLFRQLAVAGDSYESRENVIRRLIEGHLAQVVSIAQKHSDLGVPMLDLIQEGNRGLLNAVKTFAENPIGDFADYAASCIDTAIKEAFG